MERLASAREIPIDESDQQRHIANSCLNSRKSFQVTLHKFSRKDQVERWISWNRELRRHHDFRTLCHHLMISGKDLGGIPRKVTDGRIDLGDADFHRWNRIRAIPDMRHKSILFSRNVRRLRRGAVCKIFLHVFHSAFFLLTFLLYLLHPIHPCEQIPSR